MASHWCIIVLLGVLNEQFVFFGKRTSNITYWTVFSHYFFWLIFFPFHPSQPPQALFPDTFLLSPSKIPLPPDFCSPHHSFLTPAPVSRLPRSRISGPPLPACKSSSFTAHWVFFAVLWPPFFPVSLTPIFPGVLFVWLYFESRHKVYLRLVKCERRGNSCFDDQGAIIWQLEPENGTKRRGERAGKRD